MTDGASGQTIELRVMTWNVHGSARPSRNGLARVIQGTNPDLVFLQEIRIGQAHRLANRLGMQVLWTRKHFPFGPLAWWRAEGHAVLSRRRITPVATWLLSPDEGPSTWRRRIAQRVDVHLGSRTVPVINTHLASHTDAGTSVPDGRTSRAEQVLLLARHVTDADADADADDGRTAEDLIVAGDLNTHDEAGVLAPLEALGMHDCWVHASSRSGSGNTVPARSPERRIDYVFAGPRWTVRGASAPALTDDGHDWASLSDHLPVVVDLAQ